VTSGDYVADLENPCQCLTLDRRENGLKLIVFLSENRLGGTVSLEPGKGTYFVFPIKFSQEKINQKV
jgi:hypothetical protein